MDIQLKRGLLDVCVLAAIKNEDSYGYQIIKDLKPYIALKDDCGRGGCRCHDVCGCIGCC